MIGQTIMDYESQVGLTLPKAWPLSFTHKVIRKCKSTCNLTLRSLSVLLILLIAFLVGVGTHSPGTIETRTVQSGGRHFLARRVAKAIDEKEDHRLVGATSGGRSSISGRYAQFLPSRTLDAGYNCRGNVYLSHHDEPYEAVFDTGATRNTVSLKYLQQLIVGKRQQPQ